MAWRKRADHLVLFFALKETSDERTGFETKAAALTNPPVCGVGPVLNEQGTALTSKGVMFSVHLPTQGMPNKITTGEASEPGQDDGCGCVRTWGINAEKGNRCSVLVFAPCLSCSCRQGVSRSTSQEPTDTFAQNFAEKQRLQAGSAAKPACGRRSCGKKQDLIPPFHGQRPAKSSSMKSSR